MTNRAQTQGKPYYVHRAQQRFSGIDWTASLVGALTALGVLAVLGALLGALTGTVGYDFLANESDKTQLATGAIAGVFTVIVAFFVGGWASARMSRYDGETNGAMTVAWFVLIALVLGFVGYVTDKDVAFLDGSLIPNWLTTDDYTFEAIISALVGLALMLISAMFGGRVGEKYHLHADAAIAAAAATGPEVDSNPSDGLARDESEVLDGDGVYSRDDVVASKSESSMATDPDEPITVQPVPVSQGSSQVSEVEVMDRSDVEVENSEPLEHDIVDHHGDQYDGPLEKVSDGDDGEVHVTSNSENQLH